VPSGRLPGYVGRTLTRSRLAAYLASRIADVAGPGEVLASRAVVEQASDGGAPYLFEQIEDAELKGVPDSVALFRVTRSRSAIGP
jgi:class 3 adenylate cyclase